MNLVADIRNLLALIKTKYAMAGFFIVSLIVFLTLWLTKSIEFFENDDDEDDEDDDDEGEDDDEDDDENLLNDEEEIENLLND